MGTTGVVTYKRVTFLERLHCHLQACHIPGETAGLAPPAGLERGRSGPPRQLSVCTCLACPVTAAVPDVTSACAQDQIVTHPSGQLIWNCRSGIALFSSRLRLSLLPAGKVSNSPSLADLRIICAPMLHTACRTDGHHPECLQDMLIGCAEYEVAAILGLT